MDSFTILPPFDDDPTPSAPAVALPRSEDEALENTPGLELVPCPECGGTGWLECHGSAWSASCNAWGRPDLDFTYKPCARCHCEGKVLDLVTPVLEWEDLQWAA